MQSVPAKISERELAAICSARGIKMHVTVLEETGSTNEDAARILGSAEGKNMAPFAIFANQQTAGKGRIGRRWESKSCGNIYASFGFAPEISPSDMANFTPWMGASVCDMLVRRYKIHSKVKWPNDLFCGDKKLAGILTEAHMDSKCVRSVVFGIGLNVLELPEEFRCIATSIASAGGISAQEIDINTVAADLISCVEISAQKFFSGEFSEKLRALWECYDMLRGKQVTAIYGDEEFAGTAQGIDLRGNLKILSDRGEMRTFSAGDVTLKK